MAKVHGPSILLLLLPLLFCSSFTVAQPFKGANALCARVCEDSVDAMGKTILVAAVSAVDRIFDEKQWNMMEKANQMIDRIFRNDQLNLFGRFQTEIVDRMFNESGLDFWGRFNSSSSEVFRLFLERHVVPLSDDWKTHTRQLSAPYESRLDSALQKVDLLRDDFKTAVRDTFKMFDEKTLVFEAMTERIRMEMNGSTVIMGQNMQQGTDQMGKVTNQMIDQIYNSTVMMAELWKDAVGTMEQLANRLTEEMLRKVDEKMIEVHSIADSMQIQANVTVSVLMKRMDTSLQLFEALTDRVVSQVQTLSSQWSHLLLLLGAGYMLFTLVLHVHKQKRIPQQVAELLAATAAAASSSSLSLAAKHTQHEQQHVQQYTEINNSSNITGNNPSLQETYPLLSVNAEKKSGNSGKDLYCANGIGNDQSLRGTLFQKFVAQVETVYLLCVWAALALLAFECAWVLLITKKIAQQAYGASNVLHFTLYGILCGFLMSVYLLCYAVLALGKYGFCKVAGIASFVAHAFLACLLAILNGYLCFIVAEQQLLSPANG